MLRTRFDRAVARFTLDRLDSFRLERFPRFAGMHLSCATVAARTPRGGAPGRKLPGAGGLRAGYSSQSRSRSFLGRYSSVMKLMPRRERASSSYFFPERTISWISRCHCLAWNQG